MFFTKYFCLLPIKLTQNPMNISALDWGIIVAFFIISLLIGLFTAKKLVVQQKNFSCRGATCRGGYLVSLW